MRYLLDTNIVSELRKGVHCDPAVAAWEQAELIPHGGAISVLTIGEIRKGIQLISQRDQQQAARLEPLVDGPVSRFRGPDLACVQGSCGRMGAFERAASASGGGFSAGGNRQGTRTDFGHSQCAGLAQLAFTLLIRSSPVPAHELKAWSPAEYNVRQRQSWNLKQKQKQKQKRPNRARPGIGCGMTPGSTPRG